MKVYLVSFSDLEGNAIFSTETKALNYVKTCLEDMNTHDDVIEHLVAGDIEEAMFANNSYTEPDSVYVQIELLEIS